MFSWSLMSGQYSRTRKSSSWGTLFCATSTKTLSILLRKALSLPTSCWRRKENRLRMVSFLVITLFKEEKWSLGETIRRFDLSSMLWVFEIGLLLKIVANCSYRRYESSKAQDGRTFRPHSTSFAAAMILAGRLWQHHSDTWPIIGNCHCHCYNLGRPHPKGEHVVEDFIDRYKEKKGDPDLIIILSALWDINRWGPRFVSILIHFVSLITTWVLCSGIEFYKKNCKALLEKVKQIAVRWKQL